MLRPAGWLHILSLLGCLISSGQTAAEIYKVVGSDGKITYTDKPPANGPAGTVKQLTITSHTGSTEQGALAQQPDWRSILQRKPEAAGNVNIVMFSTDWCGYCKQARQYMRSQNIAFTDLDVEKNDSARKQYASLGGRGVPFFVIGKRTLSGFSQDSFDATLREAKK
jgi:glutaredoxin